MTVSASLNVDVVDFWDLFYIEMGQGAKQSTIFFLERKLYCHNKWQETGKVEKDVF